jgi:hypothetical protein
MSANTSNFTNTNATAQNATDDGDVLFTWSIRYWSFDLVVLCLIALYAVVAVDFGILRYISRKCGTCWERIEVTRLFTAASPPPLLSVSSLLPTANL